MQGAEDGLNRKPDATPLVIDEDKLLYTAHFTVSFDRTKRQRPCGRREPRRPASPSAAIGRILSRP